VAHYPSIHKVPGSVPTVAINIKNIKVKKSVSNYNQQLILSLISLTHMPKKSKWLSANVMNLLPCPYGISTCLMHVHNNPIK
jgi:hypothetical protein